jgi:predicted RNA-binding protein with PUA-like domain
MDGGLFMNYWLFKSERDVFTIEDLKSSPNMTSSWEGVRNYQARNYLRDSVKLGDIVFFYYSRIEPTGIIGLMEIVKEGYIDHFAFDKLSPYYDPKSKIENPVWYMVDVKFTSIFKKFIPLKEIKSNPILKEMVLVKNSRLSIQPVLLDEAKEIIRLAQN